MSYFLPCHHVQCKWLAKTGRRHGECVELLTGPCFLESHSFFLCLKQVLVQMENEASLGYQCLHSLSCIRNRHTPCHWLRTLLNSTHSGSFRILCLRGMANTIFKCTGKEWWASILAISALLTPMFLCSIRLHMNTQVQR